MLYHQLPLHCALKGKSCSCMPAKHLEFLIGMSKTTTENKKIWKKMVWEHGPLPLSAILNRYMDIVLNCIQPRWQHLMPSEGVQGSEMPASHLHMIGWVCSFSWWSTLITLRSFWDHCFSIFRAPVPLPFPHFFRWVHSLLILILKDFWGNKML